MSETLNDLEKIINDKNEQDWNEMIGKYFQDFINKYDGQFTLFYILVCFFNYLCFLKAI